MSRVERLSKLIRKEISEIIREDVSDPRIGFVSITKVDISPDLENALVFISVLGDESSKKDSMNGLTSATSFIRGKLGNAIELRDVPNIQFVRDDSLEKGDKVLGILKRERNSSHH